MENNNIKYPSFYHSKREYLAEKEAWFNLAYEKLYYIDNLQKDIVFFGDSLTSLGNFTNYFSTDSFFNAGLSGDTTDGLFYRIETNVINLQPKKIVILAGVNDIYYFNRNSSCIVNNLVKIIEEIQKKLPNVIIILPSLFPVQKGKFIPNEEKIQFINKNISVINQNLEQICKNKKNCKYFNIYHELQDQNGYLNSKFTEDGVHLNKEGYDVYLPKLKKLLD